MSFRQSKAWHSMTPQEQQLLTQINKTFGPLTFTRADPGGVPALPNQTNTIGSYWDEK